VHTNDGYEHQYDILFGAGVDPTLPGERAALAGRLVAATIEAMSADGYRGHEFGYPVDEQDLTRGIATYGMPGHLAHGYFQMRQAISILGETHPYLPYERRVRANRGDTHWRSAAPRIRRDRARSSGWARRTTS
jgi:hypothetical protein